MKIQIKNIEKLTISEKINCLILLEIIFLTGLGIIGYFSRYADKFPAMLIISVLIMLKTIILATLGILIIYTIKKPLENLLFKIQQISIGNLEVFQQKISDRGIIRELFVAINVMTGNLQTLFQKEQFTKKREQLLRQIISASISSLNKEEIIRTIVTKTGELFKADRCFFAPYDYEKQESLPIPDYAVFLSSLNIKNISGLKFEEKHIAPFKSIAFQQKQIVVVNNVDELNVTDEAKQLLKQYDVKSYMAAPLFMDNTPLGVISVQFTKSYKTFSEEEIDLIIAISEQTSIALRQAGLFSEIQNSKNRELLLRKIIETIRSTLDIDEVLRLICQKIGEIFNVQRVTISQYPINEVRSEYKSRKNIIGLEGISLDKNVASYWDKAIESNLEYIAINDINQSNIPEYLKNFYKSLDTKSIIGIPIKGLEEKWGGLLLAQTDNLRYWTEDEIQLLKSVSGQIYIAIKQAELYSTTKRLADRESLLRSIISKVRTTLDIDETLQIISREIAEVFNIERVILAEFPNKNDLCKWNIRVDYINSKNMISFKEANIEKVAGKELGEYLINSNNALILENDDKSDIPYHLKESSKILGIKSALAIPIRRCEDFWGSLSINMSFKREWTEDEISLLNAISEQIYFAIKHAEIFTTAKKLSEREILVRKIVSTIRESLDIDETIRIICDELARALNVQRATIAEFPEKGNYKYWVIRREYKVRDDIKGLNDIDYAEDTKEFWGKSTLDSGKSFILDNISESDSPDYFKRDYATLGVKSIIGVPIKRGNDKWGVIGLSEYDNYRHWTEDEINLVETIADQIYLAIKQGELYSSTKNFAERENLLRRTNNTILSSKNLEEALDHIAEEIISVINVDRISLALYDPALNSFSSFLGEYRKNEDIPSIKNITINSAEFNSFLYKNLFEKRDDIVIENLDKLEASEEIINILKDLKIKSGIIAPIIYQNYLIGFVLLTNTQESEIIKKENLDILNPILQQIAIGINMFQITNRLNKSLESEKAVRDIFIEARKYNNHDQLFNYLLERLVRFFNVDRALHLHFDNKRNIIVHNEFIYKENLNTIIHQPILLAESTSELEPKIFGETVLINNVDLEISNENLKDYLKSKNIMAFIAYPMAKKLRYNEKIKSTNLICSSGPRIWTSIEIDTFKLIIDTISLVYFELIQRKETEIIRNTFLATLTHDLRSPIIAEQTALNAILAGKLGYSLNEYSEYLEDIFKTNEELLRIVNNILSVYHFESGQLELKLELTSIEQIIYDSIRSMKALAKEQQSEITTSIEPNLPEIYIDKDEINRVITNLISNAIKHTTKGTNINVSAKKEDDTLEIAIQDNGPGIPEEEKSKIFERYPTAKRKIGTGLGLYLSKQIVEVHKGKIWFESEENKGTTFYFTLPYRIYNHHR